MKEPGVEQLDRPIFILGVGRCGSTIFHEVFAHHPDLTWMSPLLDRYPREPERNARALGWVDAPLVGRLARRKFRPEETYQFWNHYYRGFAEPCRDLTAADVTPRLRKRLPAVLARAVSRRRPRLLVKLTGWPRLGFLQEIFPDARFVHVIRDWRGTVNSLLNVHFWRGWQGPAQWRWGLLSEEHDRLWRRHDRSFVALAAIQIRIYSDAMQRAAAAVDPKRFLEVRYEDVCARPEEVFGRAARFCQLDYQRGLFGPALRKSPLRDSNFKWRKELTPAQQECLHEILGDLLERDGYETTARQANKEPRP